MIGCTLDGVAGRTTVLLNTESFCNLLHVNGCFVCMFVYVPLACAWCSEGVRSPGTELEHSELLCKGKGLTSGLWENSVMYVTAEQTLEPLAQTVLWEIWTKHIWTRTQSE